MKNYLIKKLTTIWLLLYAVIFAGSSICATHNIKNLEIVDVIETSRLILRKFSSEDAPCVFENLLSDSDIVTQLGWEVHTTVTETENWINENLKSKWCITLKGQNKPIGIIGVSDIIDDHTCELNFAISKNYQNNGIMTEALSSVRWYLLAKAHYTTKTDFTKLLVSTKITNHAARKVLMKTDFKCVETDNQCPVSDQVLYQTVPSYEEMINIEF